MSKMLFRVLRHFTADGSMRKPGDVVDATEWKNRDALVNQRYMVATTDESPASGLVATPDPAIAQAREQERAAGREVGPSDDVAADDKVLGRDGKGAEGGAKAVTEEEGKQLRGTLPEDFPGLKALNKAKLTTYAKVRSHLDNIEDVKGIAEKTGDEIRARFGVPLKFAESPEADAGSEGDAEAEGDSVAKTAEGAEEGAEGASTEGSPGDSSVPKAPDA